MEAPSVFISYSHQDGDFARKLARDLEVFGARVWIDQGELNVGDSLISAITAAIDSVDFLAAILSNSSISSSWVKEELNMALTGQIQQKPIKVLPILIDDCELPGFLRSRVYADFRRQDSYEDALESLAKSVGLYFIHGWLRSRLERYAGRMQQTRVRELLKLGGTACPSCGRMLRNRLQRLDDGFLVGVNCDNLDFHDSVLVLY